MTSVEHEVRVMTSLLPTHAATCRCGWSGKPTVNEKDANEDAVAHAWDHAGVSRIDMGDHLAAHEHSYVPMISPSGPYEMCIECADCAAVES